MRKRYRIKKNEEFQYIFKEGKSFANRQLVIYYTHSLRQDHFRVGLSVGIKIGHAATRNRIKRYLRESFLDLEDIILPTLNMIIIARNPTKHMGYHDIKRSLMHLLKREKLFKK